MAKTLNNLWPQIVLFSNLLCAFRKARRGKRFQDAVAAFELNLEKELLALQRELLAMDDQGNGYWPSSYNNFYIYEPKQRLITAADFRDRVVHHALIGVIEPLLDRKFIFDTYACRIGKGQHAAVDRFQAYARRYRFVLKCDIQKYFPSIDHLLLMQTLRRRIRDHFALMLCERILASWQSRDQNLLCPRWFAGDTLFSPLERASGLPIGNLTSQFFANLYLDGFDHWVKDQLGLPAYLRYMDDFVVFGDDKTQLGDLRQAVQSQLAKFRLSLHPQKCHIHQTRQGVPFLGYMVGPHQRRILGKGVRRFRRRLKRMQVAYSKGEIAYDHVHASIVSYLGHAKHANAQRLMTLILENAVFRREA